MRSGKGENSWDCDDDGTYGLYCCWDKSLPIPTWQNTEECLELAVNMYVKGVLKDARRYGTTDKENRGFNLEDVYTYIGIKKEDKNESE